MTTLTLDQQVAELVADGWEVVASGKVLIPSAGFEPAFPTNPDESRGAAVTDAGSLPAVLLAKLETLRLAGKP